MPTVTPYLAGAPYVDRSATSVVQPTAGGGLNIQDIIKQLQDAQAKANKANAARYTQGLGELTGAQTTMRGLYGQASEQLGQIGQAAASDVTRGAQSYLAGAKQDLVSRGLGNTTLQGATARRAEELRRSGMMGVEEAKAGRMAGLLQGQAGAEMGQSGNIAQFISAANDQGPDLGAYSGLLAALSAQQTGQQPQTIDAGLGPNARAGLDVFGQPMTGGSSSSFGPGGGGDLGGGGGDLGGGGGGISSRIQNLAGWSPGTLSMMYPNLSAKELGEIARARLIQQQGSTVNLGQKGSVTYTPGTPSAGTGTGYMKNLRTGETTYLRPNSG